ncbi:GNAT family N-acetyltransferase [Danxiaibacter flavus]|uniref:GNAT family N-acetyltransferase n=1 Tax=Danxiaibacter flavus TaxID=3049108 RepID=A0ABV3ZBR2_9BACT|nr:GNAT family N-acetyltransferase [Chitinophagaceae bacterium DXS]
MSYLIETERLFMRKFELADAAFILQLLNTPSWKRFIGDRSVRTIGDAQAYIAAGPLKSYSKNNYGAWLVCLKENNVPIGMCGLFKRDFLPIPDIGFAFLPEFEGKGYAGEAVKATLNYAADQLQQKSLLAYTKDNNTKSVQLLRKSGFSFKEMIHVPHENETLMLFSIEFKQE